jgi:hypothetical protein
LLSEEMVVGCIRSSVQKVRANARITPQQIQSGVCLKKSEPILRRTQADRLRFAPAERSDGSAFLPPTPSCRAVLASI